MAMLQPIVQIKYHHHAHLQGIEIPILTQDTLIDLHLTIITGTDIGLTGQDPIPSVLDTEVTAGVIHKEVVPGHIIDTHIEVHHATDTQTHIIIDGIHHI